MGQRGFSIGNPTVTTVTTVTKYIKRWRGSQPLIYFVVTVVTVDFPYKSHLLPLCYRCVTVCYRWAHIKGPSKTGLSSSTFSYIVPGAFTLSFIHTFASSHLLYACFVPKGIIPCAKNYFPVDYSKLTPFSRGPSKIQRFANRMNT